MTSSTSTATERSADNEQGIVWQGVVCAPQVRTQARAQACTPGQEQTHTPLRVTPLRATQLLNEVFGGLESGPHVLPLPESPADTAWERTITHLSGLPVDLTVHGWRLTGTRAKAGIAMRRASNGLRELIQLTADDAQDAPLGQRSVTVMGPATVMHRLALPNGEPIASDHAARTDIAQAWCEGITELVPQLASLPGATPVVRIIDPDAHHAFAGSWRSSSRYRRLAHLDQQWWESLMADAAAALTAARTTGSETQTLARENTVTVWLPEAARGRAQTIAKAVEKNNGGVSVGFETVSWPEDAHAAENLLETIEALADGEHTGSRVLAPLPESAVNEPLADGKARTLARTGQSCLTRTADELLEPLRQAGLEPRHLLGITLQASYGFRSAAPASAATTPGAAQGRPAPELTDLQLGRGLTRLNDLAQKFSDIAHG